jgi:hypothetical protein
MGTTISSRCHRRVLWRSSEHREILLDGATGRFRRQTRSTFDAVAVAGVGLDQTGVDGKAFATDQTLGDAALQERRLCEEVHLNLAYRWFCRLGLDGAVGALVFWLQSGATGRRDRCRKRRRVCFPDRVGARVGERRAMAGASRPGSQVTRRGRRSNQHGEDHLIGGGQLDQAQPPGVELRDPPDRVFGMTRRIDHNSQ